IADSSRPFARRTFLRHDTSWLTSRIARIGFSSDRSRITVFASTIRSTRSVTPTFSHVVNSDMFESPTITWSRRKRSASACGSSRVLMIGRDRVVALETPSQMCSPPSPMQNTAPPPRLGGGHDVHDRVALGRRVLGVRSDVQVQARSVLQEHVGRASPVHHPPEQVSRNLVRAEAALAAERAC